MEADLEKNLSQKLSNYIILLQDTNKQLVKTLEMYVNLLDQFKSLVPDPASWKNMLDTFNETLKAGQRVIEEETLHRLRQYNGRET